MPTEDFGLRRIKYLKTGCKECKRRKIKCDEYINPPAEAYIKINHQGRKLCWQCTRLNKPCEYPMKGERVARVSRKVLLERAQETIPDGSPREPGRNHYPRPRLIGSISEKMPFERALIPVTSPHCLSLSTTHLRSHVNPTSKFNSLTAPRILYYTRPQDFNSRACFTNGSSPSDLGVDYFTQNDGHTSHPNHYSTGSNESFAPTKNGPYDSADFNTLAQDLNNLVSDMIIDFNDDLKEDTDLRSRVAETLQIGENMRMRPRNHSKSYIDIPRNVGIENFDLPPKEKRYLEEFHLGFASVILPFNAYDSVKQAYYNPIRDILFHSAYNESFVLAAILSQGARSVFLKSGSSEDELAYFSYLLKCLELLGPALGDPTSKVDLNSLPNIESVLLTVLLLTSSNATNPKQNWRPHLRGAKDILLKHPTSWKRLSFSKILILCKYWFIGFEILAGLGSRYGGTIESEEELDLLFDQLHGNEYHVLSNMGLISRNGFFLLGGFHMNLITPLKDLIKLLNKKRRDPNYAMDETMKYLQLLSAFEDQTSVEFVNKKALLKKSDFQEGCVPVGLLLDEANFKQEHLIISWMDLSQQLYCFAAIGTILTEFLGLSYDSPQVQAVVYRITSYLEFLLHYEEAQLTIKCAIMMIQWPMYVAGLNLVREKDQLLTLKVFDLARNAGGGSAAYINARMKRIWKYRVTGLGKPPEDDIDVVCY